MNDISKVVAIVQARMTSHRLPGKSLQAIGGVPVAELVLRRLQRAKHVDQIVLATSTSKEDDVLANHVRAAGFEVFRGSENDLLSRYTQAAITFGATTVIRVCADNVFVDPGEIDRLIEHGNNGGFDFVGFINSANPDRKNDFGGEFIRMTALDRAHSEATMPHDREHVFPYFDGHPDRFRLDHIEINESLRSDVKLDLDYPEDLLVLRQLADVLGDPVRVRSSDVAASATALFGKRVPDYEFSRTVRQVPKLRTTNRIIDTPLPLPEAVTTIENIERLEGGRRNVLPVVWRRGSGHRLFDAAGNSWIDLTSLGAAHCGHSHPEVTTAIRTQLRALATAGDYATDVRARCLEKLLSMIGPEFQAAAVFATRSEAAEHAFKLAKLHGQSFAPARKLVIGGRSNDHGWTLAGLLTSGDESRKRWIGYRDPNLAHLAFPYPWVLKEHQCTGQEFLSKQLSELEQSGRDPRQAAAIFLDAQQAWAALSYPTDYLQKMRRFCDEHQVLMVVDESETGFGRNGAIFEFAHHSIQPDIFICSGFGSGAPIAAVIGRKDRLQLDNIHSSAHLNNPLAWSAALAGLQVLERERLVSESARKGSYLLDSLERLRGQANQVGDVFGRGLHASVFLKGVDSAQIFADRVIERAFEKGVYCLRTARGTLKLAPPLTIPDEAIAEGVQVLAESIHELSAA